MILKLETTQPKEIEKLKQYLINYFTGLEDPLRCEPSCRRENEEINCSVCVKEYIDNILEHIIQERELYF